MSKPLVFNYKQYEELREAYRQLLEDNQKLMADNRKIRQKMRHQATEVNRMKKENTDLKIALFSAYLIIKAEVNDVTTNN